MGVAGTGPHEPGAAEQHSATSACLASRALLKINPSCRSICAMRSPSSIWMFSCDRDCTLQR